MKRRSLTLVICLLATLSLASVGFASWVISAGDTENVTGNVVVQTVTDKRLEIKNGAFEKDGLITLDSIKFGIPSEDDGYDPSENDWLKPDGAEFPEDILSIKYIFDLNFVSGGEVVIEGASKNVELTAEFVDDGTKEWIEQAVTFGYIEQPTLMVAKNAVTGKYECTITFQWGALFENKNPWEYYNAKQIAGDAGIVDYMFGQKLTDGSDITVYHLLYQLRDVTVDDSQAAHVHSFNEETGKCTGSYHCKGDDPRTVEVEATDNTFDYPCRAMQADYGDHALLVLERMYDFLNSKTFNIIIEAKEHVHSYDALTNTCECGATK